MPNTDSRRPDFRLNAARTFVSAAAPLRSFRKSSLGAFYSTGCRLQAERETNTDHGDSDYWVMDS